MDLRTAALGRLEPAPAPAEPSVRQPDADHRRPTANDCRPPSVRVPAGCRPSSALDAASGDITLACPWCESLNVEQVGAIGSHLMVAQYICLDCYSPFEVIRR
jgi:hypothetical protein